MPERCAGVDRAWASDGLVLLGVGQVQDVQLFGLLRKLILKGIFDLKGILVYVEVVAVDDFVCGCGDAGDNGWVLELHCGLVVRRRGTLYFCQ